MAKVSALTGGNSLAAKLKDIIKKAETDNLVKVGFFPGTTETASGVPTAYVAACNEFGGTLPARTGKNGNKLAASKRPARPFFRRMIQHGSKHWGQDLAAALVVDGYDAEMALEAMGMQLKAELQASIKDRVYAPLADSTIKAKGFDQTLVDSADMLQGVQYEVE